MTIGIPLLSWYDWNKHKKLISIGVSVMGLIAFALFCLSLFSFFPIVSLYVTFILIPTYAYSLRLIYRELMWMAYAILFSALLVMIYVEFSLNIRLSLPLNEWPITNYLWVLGISIIGIGFFVEL